MSEARPAQVESLPVTLLPLPNELLSGLCLRNDEANGWPANSVSKMIATFGGTVGFARPGLLILATSYDLDALATLLECAPSEIAATTFRVEMQRMFGPLVSARRIGRVDHFRICPLCIRERRYISRDTALPLITHCSEHSVELVAACTCGSSLGTYRALRDPFACPTCLRDWGALPVRGLEPRKAIRARQVAHAYNLILERGAPGILEAVRPLMRPSTRWSGAWAGDEGGPEQCLGPARFIKSVSGLVNALIVQQVPPERLFDQDPGRAEARCRNRTCPGFGESKTMVTNGYRDGVLETYCSECGSRFLGDKTILSFDVDNGSPSLRPIAVVRARARLAQWHERLAATCDDLATAGEPLHIREVFEQAEIPRAGYLHAPRLGLVALVHARLGRIVQSDPEWPLPDTSPRWRTARAGRGLASAKPGEPDP